MSELEDILAQQIAWAHLPEPIREYKAIPGRRFRWDFCWHEFRLLLEVQGGVWSKGSHSSGAGINRDTEKLNLATLEGFRCLHVTSNQIRSGQALKWIQQALGVVK